MRGCGSTRQGVLSGSIRPFTDKRPPRSSPRALAVFLCVLELWKNSAVLSQGSGGGFAVHLLDAQRSEISKGHSLMSLFKRSATELVGTFWLVLGGCGSAVLA